MAAEIPIRERADWNSEFRVSENADCNTSGDGAYDVEVVKSTTGGRAVGFTVGVGRACVEVSGSLTGIRCRCGNGSFFGRSQ